MFHATAQRGESRLSDKRYVARLQERYDRAKTTKEARRIVMQVLQILAEDRGLYNPSTANRNYRGDKICGLYWQSVVDWSVNFSLWGNPLREYDRDFGFSFDLNSNSHILVECEDVWTLSFWKKR